ncbi:hypothetical protein LTR95_001786 [Oleoguttula sp. CCFEE 5521]
MASRFEALAPELRVQILEHVVRAEHPLRNKSAERADTADKSSAIVEFDKSILLVSRQVHQAAIVALHEVNTIVISAPLERWTGHRGLLQRCQALVLKFKTVKEEPDDVRDLVMEFRETFPKARGLTLRLRDSPFTGGLLFSCIDDLVSAEYTNIRFSEIGMLRAEAISCSRQPFELRLASPYIIDWWKYFSNLRHAHADLRRNSTRLVSETRVTDGMRNPDSIDYRRRIIRLGIVTLMERLSTEDRSGELEALERFRRRYPAFQDYGLGSFTYQTAWINWLRGVFIPDDATL